MPGAGGGEQGVGAVDLVAGGAEVLPDRAEVGAAGDAVLHQPGGLGPVSVGGGAGVDAQLGLQRRADRSGLDEADQALGEDRVGFHNSATGLDLGFYAARLYSLRRPPRTGRRWIRSWERSAAGWSARGGQSCRLR